MVKTNTRFARSFVVGLATAVLLAGCRTYPQPHKTILAPPSGDALAFAQAACGGCHATEYPELSPNPAAPTFASIANREGLNAEMMARWLADAHNYPEVMDFDLNAAQVEVIAQHMLTLRSADYVPVE